MAGLTQLPPPASTASRVIAHAVIFVCPATCTLVKANVSPKAMSKKPDTVDVYDTLPIVPLRDVIVFPHMMMPFVVDRPSSTRALDHALTGACTVRC